MELTALSILGTGILVLLALGSIIILVHSYTGTDTKRRLTRLEDGQAKLEKGQKETQSRLAKIEDQLKQILNKLKPSA